jgi:hypothetical protein
VGTAPVTTATCPNAPRPDSQSPMAGPNLRWASLGRPSILLSVYARTQPPLPSVGARARGRPEPIARRADTRTNPARDLSAITVLTTPDPGGAGLADALGTRLPTGPRASKSSPITTMYEMSKRSAVGSPQSVPSS